MPAALPSDGAGATAYRITLPEFEGPLDLLLHLCQTHELDILNISIAFVAQKYIEYLELMQDMAVEVAADYLVMAAHLAYLKSRELVPSPEPVEATEEGEESIDPREELIRRLLEYQKYKHAAENLGNRPIEGRNVFVRGSVLEPPDEAGLAEHSVWKLIEHWAGIIKKAEPQLTHDVVVDRMSITDRINQVVDLLTAGKGMVRFEDLLGEDLPPAELRHKVVVSLLAVLELARLRVIRILQHPETGSFFLAQTDNADLEGARHLQVTSAKGSEPEATETAGAEVASAEATSASASESPTAETASLAAEYAPFSDEAAYNEAAYDESVAENVVLDEPHSPLEEGATAAVIASAEDAAAEADRAAAEAEEAFPEDAETEPEDAETEPEDAEPEDEDAEPEPAASAPESSTIESDAPDATAPEAAASATEGTPLPLENASADGSTDAQALPEQVANDSVRQGGQDGVVSAPFPAPAPAGEELINGQTQEEQETSEK
jgi:segregation and condensation protein A